MAPRIVETSDPVGTESLGAELAASLSDGDVVLVRGELGSGKTTLVRGAARALGVTDPVTSPTLRHRPSLSRPPRDRLPSGSLSPGRASRTRIRRCSPTTSVPGRIAFVEWPSRADRELAGARLRVTLSHRGGDRRRIEVGGDPGETAGEHDEDEVRAR